MNENVPIGFLGFGEAGYHLAKGLLQAGGPRMAAFDIHTNTSGRGEIIRQRAEETHVRIADSSADLAISCGMIFSVVTADQAEFAAVDMAPHLTSEHFYADLNSVSPEVKRSIAKTIGSAGARFVEVAVMAPVPPYAHKVPMLTGGPAAAEFARRLTPLGMKIEVGCEEIGVAAATKMCRSIVIKGMEALLTECVLAASRYHATERVFASLGETFPEIQWDKLATYMISRVVVHGERRAREMEEVVATLTSSGVDPIMAEATARRMDWSAHLKLASQFDHNGPRSWQEAVEAVARLEQRELESAVSR